jgi:hypothetical protein
MEPTIEQPPNAEAAPSGLASGPISYLIVSDWIANVDISSGTKSIRHSNAFRAAYSHRVLWSPLHPGDEDIGRKKLGPNCLPGAGSFWASFRNSSLSARGKNKCFVWDAWHHRYDLAIDRKLSSFYKEL